MCDCRGFAKPLWAAVSSSLRPVVTWTSQVSSFPSEYTAQTWWEVLSCPVPTAAQGPCVQMAILSPSGKNRDLVPPWAPGSSAVTSLPCSECDNRTLCQNPSREDSCPLHAENLQRFVIFWCLFWRPERADNMSVLKMHSKGTVLQAQNPTLPGGWLGENLLPADRTY